jgi:uncharacterized protein (TIGR03083 family)
VRIAHVAGPTEVYTAVTMDVPAYIAAVQEHGAHIAAAAETTDLDTPIPTCPEWTMRDLVRHTGEVHRWATSNVRNRRDHSTAEDAAAAASSANPDDLDLVAWFRAGCAALVSALEAADPHFPYWSFHPAASGLTFWARRQAHETAIHRTDAQIAAGAVPTFTSTFAADGIDEMLLGFVSRPRGRLHADPPRTLAVCATDVGRDWHVTIGPERVEVRVERSAADCQVQGAANDLYLLLWNRRLVDGLAVEGDGTLLDLWRNSVRIRWS